MPNFRQRTNNAFRTKREFIYALVEDLNHYQELAIRQLDIVEGSDDDDVRRDAMQLHMVYGFQFHTTADNIQELTGVDPRAVA